MEDAYDQCSDHMEDDSMLLRDESMEDSDFMMPMETSCGAMDEDFSSVEAASSASKSHSTTIILHPLLICAFQSHHLTIVVKRTRRRKTRRS